MSLIKGYQDGSDITILNNWYVYPKKDPKTDKYDNGSMTVIYRDNITGEKHHYVAKNPKCRFYMAKPEVYLDHNELFLPESQLDKIIVPYKDQLKVIAELTGNEEFYYNNLKSGNRYQNRLLYTNPRVFNADYNIEDHWRAIFDEQYQNEPYVLDKSYIDIETDSIDAIGDFPEPGECPINAITIIDSERNQVHTMLLENDKNPLIDDFKHSIGPQLFEELRAFILEQVGGWKNAVRFGIDKLEFNFHFYKEEDEIRLIQDTFTIINTYKPDFVLAWNMAFDIPYIIARIRRLGYNPEDIMCHPDFDEKIVKYYVDERNKNEYAERGDYAVISSYSVYIDQMITFASRRKGQAQFKSFKLDDIGNVVAKVRKLNYHHITRDIAQLPYLDYKTFVFYNIMDTIVQKCIEARTGDIDYIFNKALMNDVIYAKVHRQTIYLTDRGSKSFRTENDEVYIIGNNVNKNNPDTGKFDGAFVADATKISDRAKLRINDVAVMLFDNLIDFDFKALYPSTMRQMNMAPNTMIGFIDIPEPIFANENRYNLSRFVRGGCFLEDLQCRIYLEWGSRWFGLADYEELYDEVMSYLAYAGLPCLNYNSYYNRIEPFVQTTNMRLAPFVESYRTTPFIPMVPIEESLRYTSNNFKEMQYANIKF